MNERQEKEEQEAQNTLTLKSGGQKVTTQFQQYMNSTANCNLISKI